MAVEAPTHPGRLRKIVGRTALAVSVGAVGTGVAVAGNEIFQAIKDRPPGHEIVIPTTTISSLPQHPGGIGLAPGPRDPDLGVKSDVTPNIDPIDANKALWYNPKGTGDIVSAEWRVVPPGTILSPVYHNEHNGLTQDDVWITGILAGVDKTPRKIKLAKGKFTQGYTTTFYMGNKADGEPLLITFYFGKGNSPLGVAKGPAQFGAGSAAGFSRVKDIVPNMQIGGQYALNLILKSNYLSTDHDGFLSVNRKVFNYLQNKDSHNIVREVGFSDYLYIPHTLSS